VLATARKVKTYAVPEAEGERNYLTRMAISLGNGRTLEADQEYPRGCPLNPVTRDDIRNKFKKLAGVVLAGTKVNEIIGRIEQLENVEDISTLVPLFVQ
jgi:2-methylcitrate dehydratase PrpD